MQTRTMTNNGPNDLDGSWELILWSDDFAIGNAGIDEDHKHLLALFNEFSMAVNAGKADVIAHGILDELADYTNYHFAREELIMLEHHYPEFDRHKKMHDTFIRQIDDVASNFTVGGDMSAFMLSFLAKWLSGHILGADRKLGRYLTECATTH